VAAAEDYLLTVRQILREQAASHRYRIQVTASDERLREHMRKAGRRSAAWIDEAVRAKPAWKEIISTTGSRGGARAAARVVSLGPQENGGAAERTAARRRDGRESAQADSGRLEAHRRGVEQARQLAAVR